MDPEKIYPLRSANGTISTQGEADVPENQNNSH